LAVGPFGSEEWRAWRRRLKTSCGGSKTCWTTVRQLRIAVNGLFVGSQAVSGALSEQRVKILVTERIGFIEIFSEWRVPALSGCRHRLMGRPNKSRASCEVRDDTSPRPDLP
jgi:hypothetical protein